MGRKPTKWLNMPKGMRARERGQKVHYYLDTGGRPRKEIPLGSDYVLAVQKWAELTAKKAPPSGEITMGYLVGRYYAEVVPTKAAGSQTSDNQEKAWILRFFDDPPAPLEAVEPQHIRQFMRWRADQARNAAVERAKGKGQDASGIPATFGQVRANRAKAVLSHMWNWARGEGITKMPNPCTGIHRFKEKGRETAPDGDMVARVLAVADLPLQFAMRLAELIGQRPADVRKLTEMDVKDGVLHVRQGKTAARLRIEITGELQRLMAEIHEFKRQVKSAVPALLVNESGQTLRADALRYRFDQAREKAGIAKKDFQFRDFRARTATEADDVAGIRVAQALLGHTTEAMTADYIRHRAGKRIKPLR